jgi:hypothetical protein
MPNFSQAELDLIADQTKPESQLPSYYDADTDQNVVISRDFEAYLILETQQQQQATLQWISQELDFQANNLDRDAILTRYLVNRGTDDTARLAEINTRLMNFDSFKAGLLQGNIPGQPPLDWSTTPELNLLSQSLQMPLDEINLLYDLTFHEQNVVAVLQNRMENTSYTDSDQEELQSWQTVISAYQGQSSGTPAPSTPLGVPIPS